MLHCGTISGLEYTKGKGRDKKRDAERNIIGGKGEKSVNIKPGLYASI